MALHPQELPPVPEGTRRVAPAAFPRGNGDLRLRDALGAMDDDHRFAPLCPAHGQPAAPPWRLALTTVRPFAAGLSDRQAADAVRRRIDWESALRLELTAPGFEHTVLSEFRTRLVAGQAELLLLDTCLAQVRERGLLKGRGRQRTDATHVLAAIRVRTRLERVGEPLRHALTSLASAAPDGLQTQAPPAWVERDGRRLESDRLPQTAAAREALAAAIGADGRRLLHAVEAATDRPGVRDLPAVQPWREVWAAQATDPPGPLRWRAGQERWPAAVLLASPYDVEARYCPTRDLAWGGDKVPRTETCAADRPHLITGAMTTPATPPDCVMGPAIQQDLAQRDRLPGPHLLEGGYGDADLLVTARTQRQSAGVGPVLGSYSHHRRAGHGDELSAFVSDWEAQHARGPQGQTSLRWTPGREVSGDPVVRIRLHAPTCRACPVRSACTQAKDAPRQLTVRPQAHHEAIQAARQRQATAAFTAQDAPRAGVAGTQPQAIRRCGLRHCRYVGHAKAELQHVLTATALNPVRVAAWWADTPRATTRRAACAALAA